MKILTDKNIVIEKPTSVTLGNFDGVHLGHQNLIGTVIKKGGERGLLSVVFTFDPHPVIVLKKDNDFSLILSKDEKRYVIENMGVDVLLEYPFTTAFANIGAYDFAHLLFHRLNCKLLVVGEGYAFGKDRLGDYELLKKAGEETGAEVIKIPHVMDNGVRISSTRIRRAVLNKEMGCAQRLLDKPYFIQGTVVKGKKIGRTIGFPTINIITPDEKLLPPDGVYLTRTKVDSEVLDSITNIGSNPTLNGWFKTVETFLFGFDEMIYGKEVIIHFYDFLRCEMKFDSVDELQAQIKNDIREAVGRFDELKQNN